MELRVALAFAVPYGPDNGCHQGGNQEAEDLNVIIGGIPAAVGKDCDGLREMQPMLCDPGHHRVPAKLVPFRQLLGIRKSTHRKWKTIQNEIAEGEAEAEPQGRIPTGRRFYCRRGNSGLKLRIMRYS